MGKLKELLRFCSALGNPVLILFPVLSVAFMLVLPVVWAAERHLLLLLPFTAVAVYSAIPQRWTRYVFASMAMSMVLTGAIRHTAEDRIAAAWHNYYQQVCTTIRENTPVSAVVISRKPNMLYYYTGRRGRCYPFTTDADSVARTVLAADYVLIEPFITLPYLTAGLDRIGKRVNLIAGTKDHLLLKVNHAAPDSR